MLGAITLLTDYLCYRKGVEFPDLFQNFNPYWGSCIAVTCYIAITTPGKREGAQFIYFQF